MIKNTVAIAYNGGAYGTYLDWCLSTLTSNDKHIQLPFRNNGNSHGFCGIHLRDIQGWRNYYVGPTEYQFVKVHPKTLATESAQANLLEIANQAQNLVYLCPDQNTVLLCLNNFFYKIWDDWFVESGLAVTDIQKIYTNWPVDPQTPMNQLPRWILREFLSYYLMPAWFDQVEWDHLSQWQHPKSITVTVSQLLFDFEQTLDTIGRFCRLDFKKSISELQFAHKKNLQLQKHINQDRTCRQIIDSIQSGTDVSWPDLPLPSEAWIQWQLRNLGFEIKCHELEQFPTTSAGLRALLYV